MLRTPLIKKVSSLVAVIKRNTGSKASKGSKNILKTSIASFSKSNVKFSMSKITETIVFNGNKKVTVKTKAAEDILEQNFNNLGFSQKNASDQLTEDVLVLDETQFSLPTSGNTSPCLNQAQSLPDQGLWDLTSEKFNVAFEANAKKGQNLYGASKEINLETGLDILAAEASKLEGAVGGDLSSTLDIVTKPFLG